MYKRQRQNRIWALFILFFQVKSCYFIARLWDGFSDVSTSSALSCPTSSVTAGFLTSVLPEIIINKK